MAGGSAAGKAVGAGSSLDPSGFEIPPDMFERADSGRFRFPQGPTGTGMLVCPDDSRFAAAVAYEIDADDR